jgi:serine/threonine protein kinase/Tol biopolymer transport system component
MAAPHGTIPAHVDPPPERPAMNIGAGDVLAGKYRVERVIGKGGMGMVVAAMHLQLDKRVALKFLLPEVAANPTLVARFGREARAASKIESEHVAKVLDVGALENGAPFIVMEYLEGETLADRLAKVSRAGGAGLPLGETLQIAIQIADALDTAHRAGIVHRDLKPGNIMLTAAGAKLLDFGLAKPAEPMATLVTMTAMALQQSPVTEQGTIVGTFQYMSPEQVEGKEVDGRSDIFSLGAVLYEMVTGKKAFAGKSQLSVASAILEKEPEPVSAVKPTSPVALDRAIRKSIAKELDARWQSASDLESELQWIAEGRSQWESVVRPTEMLKSWSRAGWLAAVGLLLLLAVVGAAWWSTTQVGKRPMHFASPFPAVANYVALSRDGQTAAMVSYAEQKNKYMIWTYRVGERNASMVEGTEDASDPFWSPDGKWIGFFSQGKLKKVDVAGTSVEVLAEAANGRGGSWNKDGVILYTPDVFTGVYRIASKGGGPIEITKLDAARAESSHRWPYFLPDGRHFLYLAANFTGQFDKNTIFVGSLDTAEKRPLLSASSNVVFAEPGYLVYLRDSDNSLVAQRFDTGNLTVSGDPQVVQSGVRYLTQIDLALFDVAGKRTLVAQTGKGAVTSKLEWFDRNGKAVGTVGGSGSFANPSLSPDAQRLAFDEANPNGRMFGIWTRDLKTGAVSRLTLDDSLNQMPIWSPDGKRVVFTSNRNRFNRLYWKNADGSGAEQQIADLGAVQEACWDWSRDGKNLLVRKDREMWAISMPDMKAKPYLQGKGTARNGQFSPDGKWVAYASNESGIWEVYVSPFPEANSKWQVSRGGGEEPRWRSDGKELFYLSADRKLMAVEVRMSGSFEARDPVGMFQTRSRQRISSQDVFTYSVSGDGQRFLVNTIMDEPNAPPLSIILNWEAEMEK